jgi:hypothetical protein
MKDANDESYVCRREGRLAASKYHTSARSGECGNFMFALMGAQVRIQAIGPVSYEKLVGRLAASNANSVLVLPTAVAVLTAEARRRYWQFNGSAGMQAQNGIRV